MPNDETISRDPARDYHDLRQELGRVEVAGMAGHEWLRQWDLRRKAPPAWAPLRVPPAGKQAAQEDVERMMPAEVKGRLAATEDALQSDDLDMKDRLQLILGRDMLIRALGSNSL